MYPPKNKGLDSSSSPSLRFRKLFFSLIIAVFMGVFYGFILYPMGISIPCPIYKTTGILCPSCGITRLCIAVLHLDFQTAFQVNPVLFLLSPLILYIFVKTAILYVKSGRTYLKLHDNILLIVIIILLVIWTFYRNFYTISDYHL